VACRAQAGSGCSRSRFRGRDDRPAGRHVRGRAGRAARHARSRYRGTRSSRASSFDSLREVEAAPAWFRQILLNCIRDQYRRQDGLPREEPVDPLPDYSLYRKIADEDPWPYSDSVHLDFLHSFSEEDVWKVLDRIKPLYRAPLVLVHMEGLSTKQVARMFGVAQGTVLSWLHRGRKLFERELWEYAVARGLVTSPKEADR
jgi:RNA polymerase sigma-70 factor, ECF subfamily